MTVLLAQPAGRPALPWFVRVAEYLGIGPAVAWGELLTVPEGGTLELGLDALLLDRAVTDPTELERLAERLGSNANAVVEGLESGLIANPDGLA